MDYTEPLDNDPTMNETPSVYDPAPFDTPLDNDPTMTEDAMEPAAIDNDPTMTEDAMESAPMDNDPKTSEGTMESPATANYPTTAEYDMESPAIHAIDNDPTMNEDASETRLEDDANNDDGFSAAASATIAAASATAAAAGSYMWAALGATGMALSPQKDRNPSKEPQHDRIDAFDPFAMSDDEPPEGDDSSDSDDEPVTSRGASGAIAIANYDAAYKGDTDSDTGDESDAKGKDTDSEADAILVAAIPNREAQEKKEKRMLLAAVCLVFFLAIFAGAYAGLQVEEERVEQAKSTEFETIPSIPKCFPDSNPTRESAFMQLSLDGMTRQASSTELQQVQDAVTGVYNGVTGGCSDVYERIMESATVVKQNLSTDSKGHSHLSIDLTANFRCDGCTAEHEYLFSPWASAKGKASSSAKGKASAKGTTTTPTTGKGGRKLRRGNSHSRGVRGHRYLQTSAPAVPVATPVGPPITPPQGIINTGKASSSKAGKAGKAGKGGKTNARAQMFIDSLDATLQTSNLPLKKVKAAYIYKQTAVWKGEKLKLEPTKKEKKTPSKGKGSTSDKLSAGRRRRH